MNQKPKYLSKTVPFGGKELKLFSIDGLTWSTRKDELLVIKERHDAEKVTAAQLKGEPGESGSIATTKPTKRLFSPRFQGQQQPQAGQPNNGVPAQSVPTAQPGAKKDLAKKPTMQPKVSAAPAAVAKKPAPKATKAAPKARSSAKPKKTVKSKRAAA